MSRKARLIEALTGTARIDPDDYSPITSTNRLNSFGYALAGWLYMLRRQKNTRIQAMATLVVAVIALWLRLDVVSWAVLILSITMVWMAEFHQRGGRGGDQPLDQRISPDGESWQRRRFGGGTARCGGCGLDRIAGHGSTAAAEVGNRMITHAGSSGNATV